mmetsp:Transcript_26652/g.49808  ORF Transcript_26652/g.49808 Transcript_26652/m.49808 type:complete len:101 (+) Transcript_26652:1850-2152(+)
MIFSLSRFFSVSLYGDLSEDADEDEDEDEGVSAAGTNTDEKGDIFKVAERQPCLAVLVVVLVVIVETPNASTDGGRLVVVGDCSRLQTRTATPTRRIRCG